MGSVDRSNAATTGTNRERESMKSVNEAGEKSSAKKMDKAGKEKNQSEGETTNKKVTGKKIKAEKAGLLESSSANCESKGTTKPVPSPKNHENKSSLTRKLIQAMDEGESSTSFKRKSSESSGNKPMKIKKTYEDLRIDKNIKKKSFKSKKKIEENKPLPKRSSALNASAILSCIYDRSSQPKVKVEETSKEGEVSEANIVVPKVEHDDHCDKPLLNNYFEDVEGHVEKIEDLKPTIIKKEKVKKEKKKLMKPKIKDKQSDMKNIKKKTIKATNKEEKKASSTNKIFKEHSNVDKKN